MGGRDGISEGMIFKLRSEGQTGPNYLQNGRKRSRGQGNICKTSKTRGSRNRRLLGSPWSTVSSAPPWFPALTQFQTHLQFLASYLRHMNTKYSLKGVFMPSRQPLICGGKSWQTNAPAWHHLAVQGDTLCAAQISAE